MLTQKERLMKILHREPVDRPACICPGGMMNMVTAELMEACGAALPEAHGDAGQMAKLARACWEQGCFENVGVPFCMTVEAEAMGATVDLGSRIIEPRVTAYPICSAEQWQTLKSLDPGRGRPAVVLEAIRRLKADCPTVPVVGNITGPVSTAASLLEPMVFYREMRKKNAQVHALMDFVTEQLLRFGLALIEAGADVITISDPSGTGEILGPRYFEEFAVASINRLVDRFRQAGVGTIVHICGQMSGVYAQAARIRSHALSFDAIVSMEKARENLPDHAIMGNVSTYGLEFGTPEKVRAMAGAALRQGVDLLAPACGLGMKTPLENEQAILACLHEVYHGSD